MLSPWPLANYAHFPTDRKGPLMWTRAELKRRGKTAFKRNYWKTVLVAAILSLLSYSSSLSNDFSDANSEGIAGTTHMVSDPISALSTDSQLATEFFLGIGFTALFVIAVLGILIGVFLFLPLQVGCQRFLFLNLREPSNVREVLWAFDSSYLNIVKVMFLRDLKIFAWALLLVIPGIVKAYEYRLVAFLLAENPALSSAEACEQSRALMDGNKWNAFVLDLSFIGWNILSLLTLGLVGLFYVSPYENSTNAALYEALRYGIDQTPVLPEE